MNFYNDIEENACEWTRELIKAGLIPDGVVSSTPIQEIKPHEIRDYRQCHFFSGVNGWPLAFRLAGIEHEDRTDSGSAPCQPFSGTGKQLGRADPRHLWPAFRRQINRRRPSAVYGEQVASKLGRDWLTGVCSDLEIMGYGHTRADLCSAGVGSPNIRQRLFWVGYAMREGSLSAPLGTADCGEEGGGTWDGISSRPSTNGRVEYANGATRHQGSALICGGDNRGSAESRAGFGGAGIVSGLGHADHARREGRIIRWDGGHQRTLGPASLGMWSDCELIFCQDQKWRRIEPGSFPLADGIPSRVGLLLTELRKLGKSSISLARANRNIRLKGYGNAINPWVAAAFIRAARMSLGGIAQPVCEFEL